MAEETKNPRVRKIGKPSVDQGVHMDTVIIDELKEIIKPKRAKKVEKVFVEELPENPTWETPIYQILYHPKFDELFGKEIYELRTAHIPEGKRRNPDLDKVLDQFYARQELMKIEYIKILNKDSQMPSAQRKWVKQIVETAVFLTIKFYEGGN